MNDNSNQMTVEMQCRPCRGTGIAGIYRSYQEPEGVGAVCINCKGTGKEVLKYTPFTRRILRDDVKHVATSTGALGRGYEQRNFISYQDFLDGKMPPPRTA